MRIRKYFGGVMDYLFGPHKMERLVPAISIEPQVTYERTASYEVTVTVVRVDETRQFKLLLWPPSMREPKGDLGSFLQDPNKRQQLHRALRDLRRR